MQATVIHIPDLPRTSRLHLSAGPAQHRASASVRQVLSTPTARRSLSLQPLARGALTGVPLSFASRCLRLSDLPREAIVPTDIASAGAYTHACTPRRILYRRKLPDLRRSRLARCVCSPAPHYVHLPSPPSPISHRQSPSAHRTPPPPPGRAQVYISQDTPRDVPSHAQVRLAVGFHIFLGPVHARGCGVDCTPTSTRHVSLFFVFISQLYYPSYLSSPLVCFPSPFSS